MARRLITLVGGTLGFLLVPAMTALAQTYPPTGEPPGGGGNGGTGDPSLPFTGASLSVGVVLVAGLLLAGVALLFVARRRRRTAATA